jgi:hypothetical protein
MAILNQLTAKSDAFGICTTVYDPDNISFKLTGKTREVTFEGTDPIVLHQRYNSTKAVPTKGVKRKHGMDKSAWLISQEDLLRFLEFRGFEFELFNERATYRSGDRRVRLFAKKTGARQNRTVAEGT